MSEEVGAAALAALDRAIDDRPDRIYGDLSQAVRCLVRLRDQLIAERRRDGGRAGPAPRGPAARGPQTDDRLERCNAILSVVSGAEFPLEGVRHERIAKAREELARLLGQSLSMG
jgi:hypothetical protein